MAMHSSKTSMTQWRNWVKQQIDTLTDGLAGAGGAEVGSTRLWHTSTVPTGYLELDGSSLNTTTYADLYAVLGYTYGGSGASFSLPDMRGRFPRGWDNTAGLDPDAAGRTNRGDGTTGDNIGTLQDHQLDSHTHTIVIRAGNSSTNSQAKAGASTTLTPEVSGATGGNETRPVNINVMYVIKY